MTSLSKSALLQATNADYANRLYQSPIAKESKRFSKPKLSQTAFTIDHYAGGVRGCTSLPATAA